MYKKESLVSQAVTEEQKKLNRQLSVLKVPSFALELAQLAAKNKQTLYLVGGALRDLFLGKKVEDYDFVCSVSAIELSKFLESVKRAKIIVLHPRFCTAKLEFYSTLEKKFFQIDLATTRQESYPFSGSLPDVSVPSTLEKDLERRDFTINALALQINPQVSNSLFSHKLIDLFGGLKDLADKKICVLHQKSYYEDPSRIIRAVRFAGRFEYQISQRDCKLIGKALAREELRELALKIRGLRFGIELLRLFELENWQKSWQLLIELGALVLFDAKINRKAWQKESALSEKQNKLLTKNPKALLTSSNRLIWSFWNSENLLQLLKVFGFKKIILRQVEVLKSLERDGFSAKLSNLTIFEEKVSQELRMLFSILRPELFSKYSFYCKARPVFSLAELIRDKNFRPKEARLKLQEIFEENLAKSSSF